jgi:hypothetical protein
MSWKTSWPVMAMLWFGLFVDTPTRADIVIQTPAGLVAGDTFRIVFVTESATPATSSDINYYNAFVNNDAIAEAGGSVLYNGTSVTFSAIASTQSTSAIANIGVTGAPVYLVNGTQVAATDSTAGLWSGNLENPIDVTLQNTLPIDGTPWTGTNTNGESIAQSLGSNYGDPPSVSIGSGFSTGPAWINDGADPVTYPLYPFPPWSNSIYGISQVLTVPTAIPEPSSIVMETISAVFVLGYSLRTRSKASLATS